MKEQEATKSGTIEPISLPPDKVFGWQGIIMPHDYYLTFTVLDIETVKKAKRHAEIGKDQFDLIPKPEKYWSPEAIKDIETFYFPCVVYNINPVESAPRYVMIPVSELKRVGIDRCSEQKD